MNLADETQSRGERERALREVIRAADGLGERGILTAIGRRMELMSTLLHGERFGEVATLGSEVRAMCEAHAPLAWDQFEGLLVPTLPRQKRSAAFERIAHRIRAHSSVLESAEVLEAALETIDPKDQPADAERVAAALEACESDGLGAPGFGTLEAWAKVAEGRAAQGDPTADGVGENVLSLAAKLFPLAPNGLSSGSDPVLLAADNDRFMGLVRAAQGRHDEAESLFRAAIGAYARREADGSRWRTAIQLAKILPNDRKPEIRDYCQAALASGILDHADKEEAEMLLARIGKGIGPYR
jgi:hypothetical protein